MQPPQSRKAQVRDMQLRIGAFSKKGELKSVTYGGAAEGTVIIPIQLIDIHQPGRAMRARIAEVTDNLPNETVRA